MTFHYALACLLLASPALATTSDVASIGGFDRSPGGQNAAPADGPRTNGRAGSVGGAGLTSAAPGGTGSRAGFPGGTGQGTSGLNSIGSHGTVGASAPNYSAAGGTSATPASLAGSSR